MVIFQLMSYLTELIIGSRSLGVVFYKDYVYMPNGLNFVWF